MLIPPTVFRELQHPRNPPVVRAWIESIPTWLRVQGPKVLDESLEVDEGEGEAICLARVLNAVAVLIDDRKGRAAAVRIGLRVTGTFGILEAAPAHGVTDLSVAIARLRETNARLDEELVQAVLARDRGRDPNRSKNLQR